MRQSDWEWADQALRDNRCSAEFAREAATRCEALQRQRDTLSRACSSLVRWCKTSVIADMIPHDQASAFLDAVRRAEQALAGAGDVDRFE
jgi:hypothetical protein